MMKKDEAYKRVLEALHQCTVEDAECMAVIVLVDNKKDTVKVYGLNIEEEGVPLLLVEAAGEVGQRVLDERKRTLQ
jgi:hypothetical protein